jgi:uncharacterized protein
LKRDLVNALGGDEQVEKIVVFGSFIYSPTPHDMDIAVFCNSNDDYLTLALTFRKKLRSLSKIIPIDLLPITIPFNPASAFMSEINKGEVVYEKKH